MPHRSGFVVLGFLLFTACGDSARDRYRDTAQYQQVPSQQYYPSDVAAQQQLPPNPYGTAPAPQYQQPQYPQPQYQQPAPQYQQPAPQYQQPAPQYQQPAPAPRRTRAPAQEPAAPAPTPAPAPPRVLISAGSTVFTSLRGDLCSSEQPVGSRVTGYVVEQSDGTAAGNVTFEVTEATRAGGAHEQPRLRLVPVEYERDGRSYPLSADVIDLPTRERRLQGSGRRDARNAVVGAAVGAVAGQLLGRNTKSTVAGAAAGAAVGGAGSYASADRDLCVAVGTRIALSVRSSIVE
jgi:hypothetical protein